jgi:hypothetical protein
MELDQSVTDAQGTRYPDGAGDTLLMGEKPNLIGDDGQSTAGEWVPGTEEKPKSSRTMEEVRAEEQKAETPPEPAATTPVAEPQTPPVELKPSKAPTAAGLSLTQAIEGLEVSETFFLNWVHVTGRYVGANKLAKITDLPDAACVSIQGDHSGLAKLLQSWKKRPA